MGRVFLRAHRWVRLARTRNRLLPARRLQLEPTLAPRPTARTLLMPFLAAMEPLGLNLARLARSSNPTTVYHLRLPLLPGLRRQQPRAIPLLGSKNSDRTLAKERGRLTARREITLRNVSSCVGGTCAAPGLGYCRYFACANAVK